MLRTPQKQTRTVVINDYGYKELTPFIKMRFIVISIWILVPFFYLQPNSALASYFFLGLEFNLPDLAS